MIVVITTKFGDMEGNIICGSVFFLGCIITDGQFFPYHAFLQKNKSMGEKDFPKRELPQPIDPSFFEQYR